LRSNLSATLSFRIANITQIGPISISIEGISLFYLLITLDVNKRTAIPSSFNVKLNPPRIALRTWFRLDKFSCFSNCSMASISVSEGFAESSYIPSGVSTRGASSSVP